MITAKEFIKSKSDEYKIVEDMLIDFAKFHVNAFKEVLTENDELLRFAKRTEQETGILWRTYDNFPLQNLTLNKGYIELTNIK